MDYESFYQELQPQERDLKDGLAALQKLYKAISRETENGDLKSLARDLEAIEESTAALADCIKDIQSTVSGFDARAYFESGEFAEQMLACCSKAGIDVRGESPVYEMFPYRIKLDMENQDVYMDRKKVQCVRPQYLADTVKKGQEKLNKVRFNPITFAGELADAYDMAVLKLRRQPNSDIYLMNLYKFLTPMGRFRREYDQQSFAFDLARLYISGVDETKNNRKFQLGPCRDGKKAIRILDQDGKEYFFSTIRFYQ